ncbi:hypothetical protein C4A76_12245 [Brevibacillus laterosporus]|uniref:Uncharacterized protein n=1 Tax=Brevibacillus laterosporus TaxID=1465 RepID=A0AAP8QDV7_BRELA|nr:hypothetical protein C4A76_12245 [Brevibacillus laterosporus]PPB02145.1 hypothetical protein C4A77_13020 [Brevibacillus laterosporus]
MLVWDNSFPLFEYKLSKENERKSISNIASNQESPTDKIHISIRDRRCWQKRSYSSIATTTLLL